MSFILKLFRWIVGPDVNDPTIINLSFLKEQNDMTVNSVTNVQIASITLAELIEDAFSKKMHMCKQETLYLPSQEAILLIIWEGKNFRVENACMEI